MRITNVGRTTCPNPGAPDAKPAETLVRNFGNSARCLATLRKPGTDRAWEELFAHPGPRGVTVRGAGASYCDAALNQHGTLAITVGEPGIVAWDARLGTLEVDAGIRLRDVLAFCVPRGWTLPVLPGTAQVTVGGAVAADVHGKNHLRAGSFSRCVEEVVLITPGQGALTVGPTVQPDLFWATVGGLGLTGVIRRVRLHLAPISTSWLVTSETTCTDLDEVLVVLREHEQSHEHVVAWIDGHAPARATGRGVVSSADHLPVADLPGRLRAHTLTYRPRPWHLRFNPGLNLVRPTTLRAANAARYARSRSRTGARLSDFSQAFHPLDSLDGWPALYGPRGLVQYQFLVPSGQERILRTALEDLSAAHCPPALVVLKRFGAASPGHLSFPTPGWTLALDLSGAAASAASEVLRRLDDLVCAVGGRIYLVKDSRMAADLVPRMYPRLDQWRTIRDAADPAGVLTSDLDRRLNLTGRWTGARS